MFITRSTLAIGVLVCAIGPGTVSAQAWPSRPIELVVPYPPGGVTDIAARVIAKKATEIAGQPMVVVNKPGAGGRIGTAFVARAPADGYTVLMGTNATHGTNPNTTKDLPYDAIADFAPVIEVAQTPLLVVATPSAPVSNIPELIDWLKKDGTKVSYASTGQGGGNHLTVEYFKMLTGTEMLHVPYKGSSPALADLMGGQVQVMFDNIASSLPHVKSGKLRALAVTSLSRYPGTPELKTVAEQGVPNFEASNWLAIYAPAGVPSSVVTKLNEIFATALKSPEVVQALQSSGLEAIPGSPSELAQRTKNDIAKWAEVVRTIGFQPQ